MSHSLNKTFNVASTIGKSGLRRFLHLGKTKRKVLNKWAHENWDQLTYYRAKKHRARSDGIVFVGITGSAGKTSTKDLCIGALSTAGRCETNPRSANEPGATAHTILRTEPQHRFCVSEISAASPGSLDLHLDMLQPTIGVLTLVARDHFKNFRSLEAIAAEKGKLIKRLPANGTAVLNIDDPLVREIGQSVACDIIWIGEAVEATIRLIAAESKHPAALHLTIEYKNTRYEIPTKLHGKHLAVSVLSAIGVALAAGIPIEDAISGVGIIEPQEGRMELSHSKDGVAFLRDDWKAPFWSIHAPLDYVKDATAPRKVAIFGTVSDYTISASKAYKKVAKQALEVADLVVFVGPHAPRASKGSHNQSDNELIGFPAIQDAATYLATALRPGDLVLLKGSNTADHLVRLMLDREAPVQCWREKCGLRLFCTRCDLVYDAQRAEQASRLWNAPPESLSKTAADFLPKASRLIVGLGNPDPKHENTAHNLGYKVVDRLVAGTDWHEAPEGALSTFAAGNETICVFKPGVSINNSGPKVKAILAHLNLEPSQCIIVHDDMDLSLGDTQVKYQGSDGGHKGVRSVLMAFGTAEFTRVRVGGRSLSGNDETAERLVLAPFSEQEQKQLAPALERSVTKVKELVTGEMKGIFKVGST